eukprot:6964966-Pyramimonas_sp.AAC.1
MNGYGCANSADTKHAVALVAPVQGRTWSLHMHSHKHIPVHAVHRYVLTSEPNIHNAHQT